VNRHDTSGNLTAAKRDEIDFDCYNVSVSISTINHLTNSCPHYFPFQLLACGHATYCHILPGGYLAFEGFSGAPETVEWTPGPEDQWLMDAKFQADKDRIRAPCLRGLVVKR